MVAHEFETRTTPTGRYTRKGRIAGAIAGRWIARAQAVVSRHRTDASCRRCESQAAGCGDLGKEHPELRAGYRSSCASRHEVAGKCPESIKDTDRYFHSPESAQALKAFIDGLVPDTSPLNVTIQMAELPPVSGYGTDWREEKNRELDLTQMFRRNRPLLKLDPEIKKKSTVPHARILKLTYPDGRRLNLKFDQIVDYWTMAGSTVLPKYPRDATDVTAWLD